LVLKDAFDLPITSQVKPFLKRTMMENILFDLSSALDVLAHEINRVYAFSIDFEKVQIDHYPNVNIKNCLRCKLNNIQNDTLAQYLDLELPIRNIVPNHWYDDFAKYRNQMIHRIIYVMMLSPGFDYLPDDPTMFDPPSHKPIYDRNTDEFLFPNYEKKRQLRYYSDFCFNKILEISEQVHEYLEQKM
jgi:hypothetical protein